MKANLLKLLPLTSILLTGCFNKSISKESFLEKLNEVRTHLVSDNEDIKDVHIQASLAVHYDYKVGEFYDYSSLGILGILSERQCTWVEDGKYYHYHNHVGNRNAKVEEISEESFNNYMNTHKLKIIEELLEPVVICEKLVEYENPYYTSVNNKYYQTSDGFILQSEVKYEAASSSDPEQKVEATKNINVEFKNKLPTVNGSKTTQEGKKSTSSIKYTYGKASFTKPTPSSGSSSQA